jgi:hypothetical protein
MKAKIHFNMNKPEEEEALKRVIMADEMASFIWELRYNFFRKYEHVEEDEAGASWYTVQSDILEAINELPFDIDDLWQ